jgi:hypothetical protein
MTFQWSPATNPEYNPNSSAWTGAEQSMLLSQLDDRTRNGYPGGTGSSSTGSWADMATYMNQTAGPLGINNRQYSHNNTSGQYYANLQPRFNGGQFTGQTHVGPSPYATNVPFNDLNSLNPIQGYHTDQSRGVRYVGAAGWAAPQVPGQPPAMEPSWTGGPTGSYQQMGWGPSRAW